MSKFLMGDRMRLLFLIMSLTGTALLLMYYLVLCLAGSRIKERWKQILLRISVVFYVFPFAYFEFYIKSLFIGLIPGFLAYKEHELSKINLNEGYVISFRSGKIDISSAELVYNIFCIACICAVIIKCIIWVIQFARCRRIFKRCSTAASAQEQKWLEELKHQLRINSAVVLTISEYISEPLVFGIATPVVIFPKVMLDNPCKDAVLLHELAHIKHHDMFWKLMGIIMVTLHWYNPVCLFVNRMMDEIDEMSSDEIALERFDHEEKMQYCNVLISLLEMKREEGYIGHAVHFAEKEVNRIKRRMNEIMKKKKVMKVLYVRGMGCVMCLCALVIGFAYIPPRVSYAAVQEDEISECDFAAFSLVDLEEFSLEAGRQESFVCNDGEILEFEPESEKALCSHKFKSGVFKQHSKKSDGSCTMKYFHADACAICGTIKNKSLYKTETYVVCPH